MRLRIGKDLTQAVEADTKDKTAPTLDVTISENGSEKQVTVTPEENQGRYILGVQPGVKSDFLSMFVGGLQTLLTLGSASFGSEKLDFPTRFEQTRRSRCHL